MNIILLGVVNVVVFGIAAERLNLDKRIQVLENIYCLVGSHHSATSAMGIQDLGS